MRDGNFCPLLVEKRDVVVLVKFTCATCKHFQFKLCFCVTLLVLEMQNIIVGVLAVTVVVVATIAFIFYT